MSTNYRRVSESNRKIDLIFFKFKFKLQIFLLNRLSVSVAIDASQEKFMFYHSGIYDEPACGPLVNHAVLAVGYGPGYWLIKNSWSAKWGDEGYVKIARGASRWGEIRKWGMCGILMMPIYPLV